MKNHLTRSILLAVVSILVLFGCKKDETSYPEIQTLDIEIVSPTKAILKGNVISTGNFNASDYGFIYSNSSSLGEGGGTKVSLGNEVKEGLFTKEVQNLILYNGSQTLFVRAYISDSKGTVYGSVVSVQFPSITTTGISPANGKAGDQIVINGQFYKLTKEELVVMFGGVQAVIEEVTSSKITVKVPAGINTSNSSSNQVNVTLSIGGQNVYSSQNVFTVIPTIKDFSPKTGPVGTTITITGDNIPGSYYYYSSNLKVYFGSVQGTISSLTANGIVTVIPGNLTDVNVPISVEFNGVKSTLSSSFITQPHTVTIISPVAALPGSSFSVFGSNFPSSNYYNTNLSATIGNIPASVSYASSGQLNVTIPNNLPAGDYKVAIKSGPFTVEASQTIKVQALSITSFSPSSGGVGKEITLQGIFMPNQSHQVFFGSSSNYSHSATGTSLKVNVPFGATPGAGKITVKYGNQSAESASNFTVLAPTISSFSPTSGVAGTVITISGAGFNTFAGNNTVKFGTISSNVISATESTLTVAVPSNLNLGAMKITVITNGQTIVSADNFTATN